MDKVDLLTILKSEVKPALGCTGPISVALATTAAKDVIGGVPERIELIVDKDTYKNSISVATPNTPYYGIVEPACIAVMFGVSAYGLEVLKDVPGDVDWASIEEFALKNCQVTIRKDKGMGVYIDARVFTDKGIGHALVAQKHDKIVLLEANGVVQYEDDTYSDADTGFEARYPIRGYRVKDLVMFAQTVPAEELSFLKEALDYNSALTQAGFEKRMGSGFGCGLQTLGSGSYIYKAKAMAAAASDARMAGEPLPAMSCASSGNVGITASVPLICVAEEFGASEEQLLRATTLSYLLTIYGKSLIGRLSPMCACAMVASIGISAAACYLMGGSFEQICNAIGNVVGSTGGVLCDGAKFGCALKLAFGVGSAIESAELAMHDVCIPANTGIVGSDADDTLALLGKIASQGMLDAGVIMCDAFIERETRFNFLTR